MDKDKISIIVPIYNGEKSLERCVNSILNQTYNNIEVILVDDGSQDNSIKICKSLAEKDSRIKIITKENGGVSSARNEGIKVADGEFVQFVDSDDFIDKTMCENLIGAIKKDDSDIVICGYKRVIGKDVDIKTNINKKISTLGDLKDYFGFLFENALFNPPWNKLYRKSKIKSEFSEKISVGEDLLFNLNYFSQIKKIILIDGFFYNYICSNINSLSSKYDDNLLEVQIFLDDCVQKFCKVYFGQGCSETTTDRVFAKEVYYLLKRLVTLNDEDRLEKIYKIKKIINNKRVKKVANSKYIVDNQIKILSFFISRNWSFAIYVFFYLKKVVIK